MHFDEKKFNQSNQGVNTYIFRFYAIFITKYFWKMAIWCLYPSEVTELDAYIRRMLCSKNCIGFGSWESDAYKRLMLISSDAYIRRRLYFNFVNELYTPRST